MKFYEQFIKYMEEADIERLAKQDPGEAYEDELDKKEAYKQNLLRQDDETSFKGDLDSHNFEEQKEEDELENEFYEILGRMKIDQPELFDMFIQRLEDKGFRDQLRSIAGVSL